MASYSVYRKTDRKPIPPSAEIITRKGQSFARWVDGKGRTRTSPLSEDSSRVLVERPGYYIDHDGPDGRRVTVKGYTDKEATESLAARLQKDAERARMGLATRSDSTNSQTLWVEAMSLWLDSQRHDNLDDVYRDNNKRLLTKVAEGCGWGRLCSIRRDKVEAWLRDIKANGVVGTDGRRKLKRPSDRTVDQYADTAKRFLAWCVTQKLLEENPLGDLKKIRRPQRTRKRRSLSEDELKRLLTVAGQRAPLYKLAALTGLRKDELKQLRWSDCRLDVVKPFIQLRPEANKARREDRIPLHPAASQTLRLLLNMAEEKATVFEGVPRPATFRRDLKKARIPYFDGDGRQADFHSLRYSFCTMLAKANVPIRTAMELMRHKDPRLTLQIYTDAGQLETDEAVARLPSLEGPDPTFEASSARHGQQG